ncbi:MFS transporter [Pantoea agglomerans]|nr:MFS transporter [Pantoea agglomerans]
MFSFFPFLVTLLTENYRFSAADIGGMMTAGVIAGNLSSVLICLFISKSIYKSSFVISLLLFSGSLTGFYLAGSVHDGFFQYFILLFCIIFYRLSVGVYYNISRAYQIHALSNEAEKLRLFSNIKFVNSIGGGIGPLIGQLVINYGGYDALSLFCASIFIFSAILVFIFVPGINFTQENRQAEKLFEGALAVVRNKVFVFFSLGAMFHFIFEAQIYTFISLKIKSINIENGVAYLFTMNSVFLIILSVIGGRIMGVMKKTPKILLLSVGSFLSCLSLLIVPMVNGYTGLAIVALIFSLGEYLVPQLAIDLITDAAENTLQRITFFNFMTSAVGLGVGFSYGTYLYSLKNMMLVNSAWLAVFLLVCLFFTLGIRASKQSLA